MTFDALISSRYCSDGKQLKVERLKWRESSRYKSQLIFFKILNPFSVVSGRARECENAAMLVF